jgi:outer membrane usher protein
LALCGACIAVIVSVSGVCCHRVFAGEVQYAKPVSNRLNITGRAIDMEVPLKDGDRELGDIPIRIEPDDSVLVSRAALLSVVEASL